MTNEPQLNPETPGGTAPADAAGQAASAPVGSPSGLEAAREPVVVTVPLPDAPKEDWDRFYKALGRPDGVSGYEFSELPELLSQLPGADETEKGFKQVAFEAGLTPKQADAVRQWFVAHNESLLKNQILEAETAFNRSREALINELGGEDALNRHLDYARKVIRKFGDSELVSHLEKSGLGNDVILTKFLAKVGKAMGEDTLHGSFESKPFISQEAARSEIAMIQSNRDHPYWNRQSPGHQEAVEKMHRLFELAYPEITQ